VKNSRSLLRISSLLALGAISVGAWSCASDGADGSPGVAGGSCTTTDNGDGTITIACPNSPPVTVPGGAAGSSCTVTNNGNGTSTVSCEDGTSVTISNGDDGQPCTVVRDEVAHTTTVTCPGSTPVVIPDGPPGADAPIPQVPGPVTATVDAFSVAGGFATIDFSVFDADGAPLAGLMDVQPTSPTRSQYFRLGYAQLKTNVTQPNPNEWIGLTTSDRLIAGLTDNLDGTYTYLSATDILATYDPTLVTRVMLLVATGPMVTDTYNTTNDFDGSGAVLTRNVVTNDACATCHGRFDAPNFPMHGGSSRYAADTCTVCHTTTLGTGGEAYFPTMVHTIHDNQLTGLGDFSTLTYPQDLNGCETCHKGTDAYWKTMPSAKACADSCHTTLVFGAAYTGKDGTLHGSHTSGAASDCTVCHDDGTAGISSISDMHRLLSNNDADQRTLVATITGVAISATDGSVTATFTLFNNGVAVTDALLVGQTSFLLSKLVPAAGDVPSYWQSYITGFRQGGGTVNWSNVGSSERYTPGGTTNVGILTNVGAGTFTYKFGLVAADVPGDIRELTQAYDNLTPPVLHPWAVPYEPTLTHRVSISTRNSATATPNATAYNKTNASFDFVPSGATLKTRNIVPMAKCQACHADDRLHSGYDIKYCVNCLPGRRRGTGLDRLAAHCPQAPHGPQSPERLGWWQLHRGRRELRRSVLPEVAWQVPDLSRRQPLRG
jgi:hypothetical protein